MSEKNLNITKSSIIVEEPGWYRSAKGVISGFAGGVTVTLFGHPFDTLKVRLQVQSSTNPLYNGVVDCFVKTMKNEGVSGLYKGVASPLVAQLFFRSLLFTSFYEGQQFFAKGTNRALTELQPWEYFASGFVAGAVGTLIDSPQDLFKSKMQIQILNVNKQAETKYRGVFHCGQTIFKNHGIRGIYQGFGITLFRNSFGYCMFFGLTEVFKRMMQTPGKKLEELEFYKIILAGGLSGMVFWILNYNVDVVKSAMMADNVDSTKRKFKNSFDCCRYLVQHEGGYKRLWKGFVPCMLRSAPAVGLMIYAVDRARYYFPSYGTVANIF